MTQDWKRCDAGVIDRIRQALGVRSIVFVGMMGAGKTSVGKRLAGRLGLTFIDADTAIEDAAKKSVTEIFAEHGEDYFRQGERRVIARLLREKPKGVKGLAVAGMPNPDPEDAQKVLNLITHAMRRWHSAHNLCHAAERKEKAS